MANDEIFTQAGPFYPQAVDRVRAAGNHDDADSFGNLLDDPRPVDTVDFAGDSHSLAQTPAPPLPDFDANDLTLEVGLRMDMVSTQVYKFRSLLLGHVLPSVSIYREPLERYIEHLRQKKQLSKEERIITSAYAECVQHVEEIYILYTGRIEPSFSFNRPHTSLPINTNSISQLVKPFDQAPSHKWIPLANLYPLLLLLNDIAEQYSQRTAPQDRLVIVDYTPDPWVRASTEIFIGPNELVIRLDTLSRLFADAVLRFSSNAQGLTEMDG